MLFRSHYKVHVSRKFFSEIVVNLGRNVGTGLADIAATLEKDSTYGRLGTYLHGHTAGRMVENLNEETGTMTVNGVPVTFLRTDRNPKDIKWQENGVRLVVDTTGKFLDPTALPDDPKGSIRGHLEAGAEKVIAFFALRGLRRPSLASGSFLPKKISSREGFPWRGRNRIGKILFSWLGNAYLRNIGCLYSNSKNFLDLKRFFP